MTTRTDAGAEKSFVSALLPWIVAAAVAVIYLLTLNSWLSIKNLQPVARLTGHTWTPEVYRPVFTLVTSPFHWLPASWVPLATNLFSAVCAFFVLVLLARSVAILPQDRTVKQRERQHSASGILSGRWAWIPPVLAVLACGLELTFWENATTLSAGMLDLLLFAYAVRCLLEYRLNKQESWILRAAIVYAVGVTDTWVMMALLPGFIVAVLWIRGLSFFQLNFLSRMFLCILVGLLAYLYLPLLHWHSDGFFWAPLQENLRVEISQIVYIFRYMPHHVQLLLAMTSLVPLLFIAIKWQPPGGDISSVAKTLTPLIFHLFHLALLVVCVWAAFDTGFGLRDPVGRFPVLDSNREQFLPLYFLSTLCIGYLAGYFLVVFRPPSRRSGRPSTAAERFLNKVSLGFVSALLVLAPIGLLCKNIPEIKMTNGPAMKNYASLITEHLPPQAVILSDDGSALMLAETWLARTKQDTNFVFLETHSLKSPGYFHLQMRRQLDLLPSEYRNLSNSVTLTDSGALKMIAALAQKWPVYYLQPSFGYYFEAFYSVPHGMDYELKRYPTNEAIASPPPLSDAVFAENENFWKEHDGQIRALLPAITIPDSEEDMTLRQRWMKIMHIPFEKNFNALDLGSMYSRALNTWGVQAQRMGRLEAAGAHFAEAAELYSDNVVAKANSDFNKKLRNGEHGTTEDPGEFEKRFGNYSSWEQILTANGAFDEPTGCLAQGIVFARGRLDRQAAQNFERSLTLAPDSLLARLWLARVDVILAAVNKDFGLKAFPLIDQLKARSDAYTDAAINPSDVFQLELAANYVNERPAAVRHLVNTAVSSNPPDNAMLNIAAQLATFYHDFTNALLVIDRELELSPNNVACLMNKGFLQIQLTNYDAAIPPLSTAISLQPTNSQAIYFRAAAYLSDDKLDEAQRDFETLQKANPKALPIYRGLAEVALRRKDTNAAVHYYELSLSNSVPNSPEAIAAEDYIKKLKSGSP